MHLLYSWDDFRATASPSDKADVASLAGERGGDPGRLAEGEVKGAHS